MSEPALSLCDIGFRYDERWLFTSLNAVIPSGHVCALLGPNGSGKTTLLRIIAGTLHPVTGTVERHGVIAYVPQLFQVAFSFTALEMVVMGRARRIPFLGAPSHQDELAALEALDKFGIAHLAERSFQVLSGGERQMVMLARALVAEAKTIILDEPTSALDMKHQHEILTWIKRLANGGTTIVFTTHLPNHALAVSDHAMLLGGPSVQFGTAAEILTEDKLSELYGVQLRHVRVEGVGSAFVSFDPADGPGAQALV